MKPVAAEDVDRVVAALGATRKHAGVAPAVLRRVAAESLAKEERVAGAIDRAKRKLHQIHSAFLSPTELARARKAAASLESARTGEEVESACASVLRCHASTRERSGVLRDLYRDLFALTGPPRSIVDLGCGLHPFALPWMALDPGISYAAVDLDLRSLDLVERLLARLDRPGRAVPADLLGDEPLPSADVALLLKLLPTLERQRTGAAARLLDRLDARALVLSFPTASLGRRDKGMERTYTDLARSLLAPRGLEPRTLDLRNERFFVVAR